MKHMDKNDLFQASHLTILLSFTIFSVILIGETFLMSWELWPLIPIVLGIAVSWALHIQQIASEQYRIWVYSAFISFTFFFYGSHSTSVFDTCTVMAVIMVLFTTSGMKPLITFLQILYYITFGYGLFMLRTEGQTFDSLIISRSVLHIAVVTAISILSRMTIDKWLRVLDRSHDEIEKLTDATDRLNDFLANVSHETRTPINAIIGLTGICLDDEPDGDRRANLVSVREAGRRVAEQIGDILDFTEIDRKRLTNNYEDYMLSSVLNDLVSEIRPYKPKDIELVIDVDPAIPSVMNTDISKLRKILRHLIINGIKYTREGGVYVRLYTLPETYGVNLVIRVTDTGIGMTDEELERIFERYYQADSGRSRQGGGLGLGMTIVSGFTSALGGFLTVSSQPGAGTTVCVSIPQKVVEPSSCMSLAKPGQLCLGAFLHLDKYNNPNVREYYNMMIHNIVRGFGVQMHRVDNVANLEKLIASVQLTHLFVGEEEYQTAAEQIEQLAHEMIVVVIANSDFVLPENSRARIMEKPFYCFPVAAVLNAEHNTEPQDEAFYCPGAAALAVDDEPMNLTVAKNILRRYGMTVTAAASGAEALELCRERRFDVIFMDHMMPGMDGIETMKRIRALHTQNTADVPIIALTANAVSTARETFMSVGFDGFVSKPIELIELERVLKKVMPVSVRRQEPGAVPEPETPEPERAASPVTAASLMQPLRECGLNTAEALTYCADDAEFYLSLLRQFAAEYAEKRAGMDGFYAQQDWKNYEILVHSLKNTLKLIGSDGLSERAKSLEFAAKDGNAGVIAQEHDALMQDYGQLARQIAALCGTDTGQPAEKEPEAETADVLEFLPEEETAGSAPGAAEDGVLEFLPEDSDAAPAADGVTEFLPDDDGVTEFAPNGDAE